MISFAVYDSNHNLVALFEFKQQALHMATRLNGYVKPLRLDKKYKLPIGTI
ncbi:MAG: hypothetical protein IJU02_07335 [Lachnospiraceae bacterium]|nr:hypothetical protein [Lachnospiraceae bacterium]